MKTHFDAQCENLSNFSMILKNVIFGWMTRKKNSQGS